MESNTLTYQIIINVQNNLKFNEINKVMFFQDNYWINFGYNILKCFPIDNLSEEKISIKNIQKTAKVKYNENINSLLIFETKIN